MAIRAANLAFNDLRLGLGDARGVANIPELSAIDMIEIKGGSVIAIATIHASPFDLVGIKPAPNAGRSHVCLGIDKGSICWVRQFLLSPSFRFHWVINALTGPSVSRLNLIRVAITPAASCCSLMFDPFNLRKHDRSIPQSIPASPTSLR